ncbi:MAG: PHP domain-containing protein [Planctomycetia bacterium]|nr:PHP domain-containing protein [Planctomycetia bacterium]
MSNPRYLCDMHTHTTRSDGNDSPFELIENAVQIGLYALGICDHDITPPLTLELPDGSQVETVQYALNRGLHLVPGYEFSCDTFVDDVHICGYKVDWKAPGILAEVFAAKESKSNAYRELCEILTRHGISIDWENDILHYQTSDGKEAFRTPDEVQRKHIFETIALKGYVANWSEAKILVRDTPEYNIKRRKIDPLDAIQLIHQNGGIAILAHPYLIDEEIQPQFASRSISRFDYIDRLIDAGLDGIEASYTYDKTTYKGTQTPEEIEEEVRDRYSRRVSFISGGSDYHADAKKNSSKVRFLGERGITQEAFGEIFES